MFMAPPDTRSDLTPDERQADDARVAAQLAEMRKTDRYAQRFSRVVAPDLQNDMDTQMAIVTEGAHILKDYTPTFSGLSGQAQAASYNMLGAFAYLIELWGRPPLGDADRNSNGTVDDEEYLAWIDTDLAGEGWITPHQFHHPDLGDVWIGGTSKKHTGRTPPAPYMETEALRQTHFALYCAAQFPKVEIDKVTVTPITGKTTEFRLRGRDSARFRALVRITGADGWIEVKTESKFGGTATKRIAIKVAS